MRKPRTYACDDCGIVVTRNRASIDPKICFDCGMRRAADAARQEHARSGPVYDRFKRNWPPRNNRTADPAQE